MSGLSKKHKSLIFTLLKAVLSVAAISWVMMKIDTAKVLSVLRSSDILIIFPALLFFALSKLAASFRTLLILNTYGIAIGWKKNVGLYWTGMFYNLFLPGGIGGDVYKAAVINGMHKRGVRLSAAAILMDRISGVVALGLLAIACSYFTRLSDSYMVLLTAGIPIVSGAFIIVVHLLTPGLKHRIAGLIGWSVAVQLLQMACVLLILVSLGTGGNYPEYLVVFLISSIAAMLPLSIGGVGIREIVFLYLSSYFMLDGEIAVTVSFTFFLISAFTSLWGAFTTGRKKGATF